MEFTLFGHDVLGAVSKFVLLMSLLHVLLPPRETFQKFPRFYGWYCLVVEIVKHFALNSRKQLVGLYPSVRALNAKEPNGNA